MSESGEPAGAVDGVHGDRIVAAIRSVQIPTVRRDVDIGCVCRAAAVIRDRRELLDLGQRTCRLVPVEGCDGIADLIDDVRLLPARMHGKVAWPGAAGDGHDAVILQLARVEIQTVDDDPVEAEVGTEGETIAGIDVDRVCVRALLPLRIDAGSLVLAEIRHLPEAAVIGDGMHGDTAASVIGTQDKTSGRIDGIVTGRAARGLQVQEGQIARIRVDGEGADGAAPSVGVHLGDGVEIIARRVQAEIGRRILTLRLAELPEGSGCRVDFGVVDGGIGSLGVIADVEQLSVSHRENRSCDLPANE